MTVRQVPAGPTGRGNATITDDGCPVEIYAAMPPGDEADVVHAAIASAVRSPPPCDRLRRAIPSGVSVLELGCGTGRIADALATVGHRVTGVDSCAAMLSHLRHTEPVHGGIETLDLARRFDAVVLAGHLVNTHDRAQRAAFLATARRHVDHRGTLVLQRYPPDYRPAAGTWSAGPVQLELRDVVEHGGRVFSATLVHRLGALVAEQDFSARVLDDAALRRTLRTAGFERQQVLTPDGRWLRATAT